VQIQAFSSCSLLRTISGFDNLQSIYSNAFYYCSNLRSIDFPRVTLMGMSAFAYCYNLSMAKFSNLQTLNSWAF